MALHSDHGSRTVHAPAASLQTQLRSATSLVASSTLTATYKVTAEAGLGFPAAANPIELEIRRRATSSMRASGTERCPASAGSGHSGLYDAQR
jgi:hypothetical protein